MGKKSLPRTLLVLDCFGHMVSFKLWHDLRFLRFLRSPKKLQYYPGQTPRVNEGPTMKRDPVIIICVDASSEPPAVCPLSYSILTRSLRPRHCWSPTRHPATNQIMTIMTVIFPTYDSSAPASPKREQCLHSKTPKSNKSWPLNLFRTLHIIFDMIRATYPSIVVATCLNHEQKTTENVVLLLRVTS